MTWPFLRRMWDAAAALKTEFIVMLEQDNTVHRRVYLEPPAKKEAQKKWVVVLMEGSA